MSSEDDLKPVHDPAKRLACMEVWGGHSAFSGAVSVPGLDVYVECEPHVGDSHGGDIYYVSNCAAGIITRLLLADVSGHGHEVSAAAGDLRNLMRRYINTPDQSKFAWALNRTIKPEAGRFATALLVSYFAPTDQLIVCNAGHPRPLLFRATTRRWTVVDAEAAEVRSSGGVPGLRNLPLGVISGTRYTQGAIQLEPGDLFVMYSDALTEVRRGDARPWGEAGLLALMQSLDASQPQTLREQAMAAIHRQSGTAPDDDVTMIVLHHNAANPPAQSLSERVAVLGRMLGLR